MGIIWNELLGSVTSQIQLLLKFTLNNLWVFWHKNHPHLQPIVALKWSSSEGVECKIHLDQTTHDSESLFIEPSILSSALHLRCSSEDRIPPADRLQFKGVEKRDCVKSSQTCLSGLHGDSGAVSIFAERSEREDLCLCGQPWDNRVFGFQSTEWILTGVLEMVHSSGLFFIISFSSLGPLFLPNQKHC